MKPQWALEEIIDAAVVERYDGDLERLGEDQHGAIHYRPLDTDHVRALLTELWGEILTPEAIDDAFERLTQHGEWPHGYCEEDEEERPLSSYRSEEDEAFDWFEAVRAGELAAEV